MSRPARVDRPSTWYVLGDALVPDGLPYLLEWGADGGPYWTHRLGSAHRFDSAEKASRVALALRPRTMKVLRVERTALAVNVEVIDTPLIPNPDAVERTLAYGREGSDAATLAMSCLAYLPTETLVLAHSRMREVLTQAPPNEARVIAERSRAVLAEVVSRTGEASSER